MNTKSKSYLSWINFCITAVLIFGSHWLPSFNTVSSDGATILFIFLGMIYGFATIGLTVPSLFAMFSLGFTEGQTVTNVLKEAIGNNSILFTIGVMMLAYILTETGVTQKFASWLISSKYVNRSPWMLTNVILFATFFVAVFMNATVPMLIFWSFVSSICDQAGFRSGDKWPFVMYFGVTYMATAGSLIMPYQVGVIANFGMLTSISNGVITYNTGLYIIWAMICALLLAIAYCLFVKFIVKPDISLLEKLKDSSENQEKLIFSRTQKISLILFFVLIVAIVGSSLIPEGSALSGIFAQMQSSGIVLLILMVALSFKENGKPIFNFSSLISKGVVWEIILMLAAIFYIVSLITDSKTGISEMLKNIFAPVLSGMNPLILMLVVSFMILIFSNLMMNAAVCCTLIPIMYLLTVDMNFNMVLFVALTNYVGGMALLLPGSSAGSAMLYSQTKWVSKKNMLIYSIYTMIITYVILMVIGYPLGSLLLQ